MIPQLQWFCSDLQKTLGLGRPLVSSRPTGFGSRPTLHGTGLQWLWQSVGRGGLAGCAATDRHLLHSSQQQQQLARSARVSSQGQAAAAAAAGQVAGIALRCSGTVTPSACSSSRISPAGLPGTFHPHSCHSSGGKFEPCVSPSSIVVSSTPAWTQCAKFANLDLSYFEAGFGQMCQPALLSISLIYLPFVKKSSSFSPCCLPETKQKSYFIQGENFNHYLNISHFSAEYFCKLGDSFAAYPENNGEKWSERQWHKGTLHQKHWAAQQVLQWNKFTALLSGQWWTEYNTKRPPQIEGLQHHCIKTQEARIAYKAGRARDSFSVVHCFLCF